MDPLWLILIIPGCLLLGWVPTALCCSGKIRNLEAENIRLREETRK